VPKKVEQGGVANIRFPHLKKIMDTMVMSGRQIDIPLVYGKTGIGKTEFVEGWIKERNDPNRKSNDKRDKNWRISTIILSLFDPTELKGFPYVSEDGEFHFAPLNSFLDEGPGIIFFDELSTANKEVQNAVLRLFSQFELGDYSVPPDVYMFCCANHLHDIGVFAQKLSTAMKTRVATYHLETTYEDWKLWAMTHDVDPRVLYFLEGHSDMLINIDPDADSMPCPRTWTHLSEQLKRLKTLGYKEMDDIYPEIAARVGGSAAAEFQTYLEVYSKIDVEEILQKGKYPSDIDTVNGGFAVTGALVSTLNNEEYELNETVAKNFVGCVDQMKEEFSVCLIGDLMKGKGRFMDRLRKQLKGSSDRDKYDGLVNNFIEMLEDDS
jgi:hypothetical protein